MKFRSNKRKDCGKEIWCTIGPSSLNDYTLTRLTELGVSLLRINLSHTKLKDISDIVSYIQSRTSIPICLDTEGAQIRTSDRLNDNLLLEENTIVYAHRHLVSGDSGNIGFYPGDIISLIEAGDFISIDFDSVLAQVIARSQDKLVLRIVTGGSVSRNKAVTILNRDIEIPVLTEKDRDALGIGANSGIRHVALSFASKASDVDEVRRISPKDTSVISKIESIKGAMNLKEIAARSDALLLDRGDLSRQINIEKIPALQKEIIDYANKSGVKIYVATNLLESMVTKPSPTRAEVNDIYNTLDDGADGLVLAAETAIGSFPVHCVMMVSKIIQQFSNLSEKLSSKDLQRNESLLLIEPHGGVLIDRMNNYLDTAKIEEFRSLDVDRTVLLDAEQIAMGTFSPLEGFMNREELDSVLEAYRLPNGVVWPIPVVLQVPREAAARLKKGQTISLRLENTNDIYALLHISDIYRYDLDKMAKDTFGTNDPTHPGVQSLKKRGEWFLGGSIDLVKRLPSEYKNYELTPRQVRTIFENKSWSKIVGFHTRNVIHRAHEHIQMLALKNYHCDGLFVHPVIGPKKKGDYHANIILKSYEMMMTTYYPKNKVLLAAFQNYSRYSGPREAVFTALCRKNFGCSHFIIGRDHTGVGNYYEPDAAKKLFEKLGDIGIIPIFFTEQYYCRICKTYVEQCEHGAKHALKISGTEGRRMLEAQNDPPEWFMRKEISRLIIDELEAGKDAFII